MAMATKTTQQRRSALMPGRSHLNQARRLVKAGAVGCALLVTGLSGWPAPAAVAQSAMAPVPATSHRGAIALAAASKTVKFVGHYKGAAALLINNGAVAISSVTGEGSGTLLGASKITGKGSASATAQCDPFTGRGKLSSPAGAIDMSVTKSKSTGCSSGESGPVTVTFTGVAVATGGTGATSGAKGVLKFSGKLDLLGTSGSQNGSYTVALRGDLTIRT